MRVIIIHGTAGSPQENWFPWLSEQVTGMGHQALAPQFPAGEQQSLQSWRETFDQAAGPLGPDDILVGHSVGAVFAMRLVEQADGPVRGTFLASGFLRPLGLPDIDPLVATFIAEPAFRWDLIREKGGDLRVYHGDDDPAVPLEQAQEIAGHLGVEPVVIPGGGHLNRKTGYTTFERLWQDLQPLLER